MKPKIKYWQSNEKLEKGWVTRHPDGLMFQHYEKEAEYDELHRDAIVQELVKNKYIICGDTHQYYAVPVFEDGYIMLSMRVWREVMEEAYRIMNPKVEEIPNFYVASWCDIEENLPPDAEAHLWTSRSYS